MVNLNWNGLIYTAKCILSFDGTGTEVNVNSSRTNYPDELSRLVAIMLCTGNWFRGCLVRGKSSGMLGTIFLGGGGSGLSTNKRPYV